MNADMNMNRNAIREDIERHPVIAILRGVRPHEALSVVEALLAEGVRIVEIPLNSPSPLASIEAVAGESASDSSIRSRSGWARARTSLAPSDRAGSSDGFIIRDHKPKLVAVGCLAVPLR